MWRFNGKAAKAVAGWARRIKTDLITLWVAARDSRTPWYAKALAIIIVAYALSPIDLIPDFIPVLGYLDEAILLPIGICLVIRMIPPDLIAEFRQKATAIEQVPRSRVGAMIVVAIWIALAGLLFWWFWPFGTVKGI